MNENDELIAEFQASQRRFQPLWTRAIGLIFLPGFLLFLIGGQLVHWRWLALLGFGVCLVGAARAAYLVFQYRRCPGCGRIQVPKWHHPYRTCEGCGARLSVGSKDSR